MPEVIVVPNTVEATVPKKRRLWRWVAIFLLLLVMLVGACGYGLYHVYETQLKPKEGEWAHTLQIGSYQVPVSIPGAMRLSTTPFWGKLIAKGLSGREKQSAFGNFSLEWDETNESLVVQCKNCIASFEGIHAAPLRIAQIRLLVHQDDPEHFSGRALVGVAPHQIELPWRGQLSASEFKLQLETNAVAIDDAFHILLPDLPELQRAQITGTVSLQGELTLPSFHYTLGEPSINHFTVKGLGTERLMHVKSACGESSNLPMDSWLVRSIIAAEDQRFEQHPGYDLEELMNAYDANLSTGAIVRGGSTITQQTAKMLFTGPDRTLKRKLVELLYAVEMERTLGKARIMQLYLDNAVWGLYPNGKILCGATQAAEQYFDTTPAKLKPEQAVWLAAMLHSPVTEQKTWEKTGKINMSRALWVAQFVRNAPNSGPRARQKVIRALKKNPGLGMKVVGLKASNK